MPRITNDFTTMLPAIHRRLHAWYALHGRRDLPWRNTPDPYAIYISEIMLQQTQVKTVLERYYHPFLKRFPTIAALAKAESQDVMKAWEGLGYYTRARNLHEAAKRAGQALPASVEGLLALPGIGRNTAHAVASFGFRIPVPVVEANIKRVLARLFAMKTLDDKLLWQNAETLLDRKNPFDYNQAMMDIGAMVCTKRAPRCGECPLNPICQGKTDPESYPAPKGPRQTPTRERNIAVFMDKQGRVYLERRTTRFLGGLYGFPECDRRDKTITFGGKPYIFTQGERLGQIRQVYSHFTLEGQVFLLKLPGKAPALGDHGHLVHSDGIAGLPLSRADSKIAALLKAFLT